MSDVSDVSDSTELSESLCAISLGGSSSSSALLSSHGAGSFGCGAAFFATDARGLLAVSTVGSGMLSGSRRDGFKSLCNAQSLNVHWGTNATEINLNSSSVHGVHISTHIREYSTR